jgi:gas vesicle protein
MADGYDRFENEGAGGGSFVMGLLTGTVLGAGLGMLFAPKSGSELRNQISEQAGSLANTASEQYRRATETAGNWAEKGREAYDKARDAVSRGADEAQRYVREATSSPSTAPAGSSTSYGSESIRGGASGSSFGSSSEQVRGGQTPGSTPSGPGSSTTRRS